MLSSDTRLASDPLSIHFFLHLFANFASALLGVAVVVVAAIQLDYVNIDRSSQTTNKS